MTPFEEKMIERLDTAFTNHSEEDEKRFDLHEKRFNAIEETTRDIKEQVGRIEKNTAEMVKIFNALAGTSTVTKWVIGAIVVVAGGVVASKTILSALGRFFR